MAEKVWIVVFWRTIFWREALMECFEVLMRSARSFKRRVDHLACMLHRLHVIVSTARTDPGFPIGGGTNRPGWAPTYDSTKFSKNCMKLRTLWVVGGAHRGRPLRSASAQVRLSCSTCRNLSSTWLWQNVIFHILQKCCPNQNNYSQL